MFPIYLLLAAFIGGLNVAIDVTAGERERGSLEALLVHPVSRQALAFGKWLAAVVLNVLVVLATLVVSVQVTRAERFQNLDVPVALDGGQALWILALLLPLALFGPAIQMLLAFLPRATKKPRPTSHCCSLYPCCPACCWHSIPCRRLHGWSAFRCSVSRS